MPAAVQSRILDAVKTRISALNLDGINEVARWKYLPRQGEDVTLPCVIVTSEDQTETTLGGTTSKDDYGRPTYVYFMTKDAHDRTENDDQLQMWRQQVMRAFQSQHLSGVDEVITCEVEPGVIVGKDDQGIEHEYSAFVLRFHTREARGFFPTPPVAEFSADDTTPTSAQSVTFTDASTNTPTSWLWEKNDGSGWVAFAETSTAQNPTQTFAAGTWSVRLTATNAGGSDVESKTNYIVIVPTGHDILTITNSGGRPLVTAAAAHGLIGAEPITLSGTADYNGMHDVFSVESATEFVLAASYTTDNTGGRWDLT